MIRRYLIGFMCMLAGLVASPLSASAQDAEEGATSEPNLQESVSEPAPEEPVPQVPDIDTLSQRAVEHYEIHYEIQSEEKKKREQRRRRGLAIGVPIAVVTVVAIVVVVAVGTSLDYGAPQQP